MNVSGSSVTLDPKEYADGLLVTAEDEGRVTMNSGSTIVRGASVINMSGGSSFTMERGTLGSGNASSVELSMTGSSVFSMGGSGLTPTIGTGREATVNISLTGSSVFTMSSGMLATSAAGLTLNVENSVFNLSGGTISNGYTFSTGADGSTTSVHSSAIINVNEGGQFNMSNSSSYIGYAGGGAEIHVNSGGVFTQNGGLVGFARGTEGGRVEVMVHDGGRYSLKGGNLAVTNAKARITVEDGGVFELGSKGKISGGAGSAATYVDIVVKSGGVFNMTDGGIATDVTNYVPEAQLLVSGSFNQSGGDVTTMSGKALVVVQEGGNYALSGGYIGRAGGDAVLDICRGGSFSLRGSGSITGSVEVALGYTPEFSLSNRGSESLWGAPLAPDAPAETGSFVFVQEGGLIDGSVRVTLVGAEASYNQSGGEITGSARVSLSEGASFTLSEWGEITGDVEISAGSGTLFSMLGGSIGGNVSLVFEGVEFVQSGGDIVGSAGISLTGGSYVQSGGSLSTSGDILLAGGATFGLEGSGSISGGNISLEGVGTRMTVAQGSATDTTVALAAGTSLSMSGGSLSGSVSAQGAEIEQSGGMLQGEVSLSGGASVEQSSGGVVSGRIGMTGSTWLQEGSSGIAHGSVLDIAQGSSFTQNSGGSVDADTTVRGGSSFTQSGFVSGSVTVSGERSIWKQTGGNITDGSTVSIEQGASLVQSSGVMDAEVVVSGGSSLTQAGSIIGSVEVQGSGSVMEQQAGGSVEGDVRLSSGASLSQQQGQITGNVSADNSLISQAGSSITGDVALSGGATLEQGGSSISGGVSASASEVRQQGGSSIAGTVALEDKAKLTQSEDSSITGDVELSNGSILTQSGSITGNVSAVDSTVAQKGGSITGDVELGGNASLTQSSGSSIRGSVTATQATISQVDAEITGDVRLSSGSYFAQKGGSIGGSVSLDDSTFILQEGSSIAGSVELTQNSKLTQAGDIGGDVSVEYGSVFEREAGELRGNISVHDVSTATLGDVNVGGNVSVKGSSIYNQGDGSISGSVEVIESSFTHGRGDIGGGVVAMSSAIAHGGGSIGGDVQLTGSSFSGSVDVIKGNVELSDSSATLEAAQIDGNVSASAESVFTLETGTIAGDVKITSASLWLGSVDVGGNIRVEEGHSLVYKSGVVSGVVQVLGSVIQCDATILNDVEVERSEFSQSEGGSISGNVRVTSSSFHQIGSIGGDVSVANSSYHMETGSVISGSVSVADSFFYQDGDIMNDVTLSEAATYTMAGGKTSGTIRVADGSTLNMADGSIEGDIIVTGSQMLQAGGRIGDVSLTLEDSTFTRTGGFIQADVTMSGEKSLYDMGGGMTGGSITLHGGNLAEASGFIGSLAVDTDSAYSQAVDLGGVGADRISLIATRTTSAVINNVGAGTLTFAGQGHTMLVGTETSSSTSDGKHSLINFSNGDFGRIAFEDDATITLNFSANVLKEAKQNNSHSIEVWLTNGVLAGLPGSEDEVNRWLSSHFVVGSGLLGDSADDQYGWQGAQGGKITLHINTDGIWISSLDGDVTTDARWELFDKNKIVIVDQDMLISHAASDIHINQLSSGGDHAGNLTIETLVESTTVTLNNHESVAGSGNGDTVFNGNIVLTGAYAESSSLRKVGEGTLTVGGSITGAGALAIEAGGIVLNGEGSSVGVLEMEDDTTLVINGSLELSGNSSLTGGSISGAGELIQTGGSLELASGVTVQVSLTLGDGAKVDRQGDVGGHVTLSGAGAEFTQDGVADVAGDVTLSGAGAKYTQLDSGNIGGGVLISGAQAEFTHGGGDIGGGVSLTGASSSFESQDGDIGGSVTLSGEHSGFRHGGGDIHGDVVMSGDGSSYIHSDGDINGSVALSGQEVYFEHGAGDIHGDVQLVGERVSFKHGQGVVDGSVSIEGANNHFNMVFTSISGAVSIGGVSSEFEQTGDISGSVELSGAKGKLIWSKGAIGGDVTLSGESSSFTQYVSQNTGCEILGNLTLSGNSSTFMVNGASIIGSVELSGEHAVFEGKGASTGGDVTLSGAFAKFSGSAVAGDVTLSGGQVVFEQSGAIRGSVALTGDGATLVGDASGMGDVTLTGKQASVSGAGRISGSVLLGSAQSSVTDAGAVLGSVTLSGDGAQFMGDDLVDGDVTLGGASTQLTVGGVGGRVLLAGDGAQAEVQGSVQGEISVEGAGAKLSVAGNVQGGVSVSGDNAVYEQNGGYTMGDVLVSGSGVSYTHAGDVSGNIVVSGAGADYAQGGIAHGSVSITAEMAHYAITAGGEASDVLLSGAGAVLDMGDEACVTGVITLQAGELAHAGAYAGAGVAINTTAAQQGELKLGGLRADKVSGVSTGIGVSLTGLADRSALTFTGMNTMYAAKESASFGSNTATAAMIRFDGTGSVNFADGGQLRLRFEREVCREFGSGTLEVWLVSGSITGMPEDEDALLAWLQEHILLATGSGQEFALAHGAFSGAHEGWLAISASTTDIWQTTDQHDRVTDPGAFDSFSKVDIDADTVLDVAVAEDSRATIRQVEGDHNLSLRNSGTGELTVEFHNEDVIGYYGDTSFYGNITVDADGSGAVSIEKTGNAALTIEGCLQTPGRVSVKEGKLILNAAGNYIGSLSLGDAATAGDLVVDGVATLTGASDLSAGAGSISGTGVLEIAGSLTLGESVSLSGVNVLLEKIGTLNINGVHGSSISGFSGNGTLNLGAEGDLVINRGGEFSGALAGSGALSTAGKGTELVLIGGGNAGYDLMVGVNTSVTLSEASEAAYSVRSAEHTIVWRSITNSGSLTVLSADGSTALTATGDITLAAGSITGITVNISAADSAALESTDGRVIIEAGSSIQLSIIGQVSGEDMSVELIRGAKGIYDENGMLLAAGTELPNVSFSEAVFELLYKDVNIVVDEDTQSVILQATKRDEPKSDDDVMANVAGSHNSRAGLDLLLEAVQMADPEKNVTLFAAGNSIAEMIMSGQKAEASRALAAVAGSSVPALGTAQRDALREQMLRVRDRVATAGGLQHTADGAKRPEVHAGIEATGSYAKLSASGDEAGYKLSSWGGTVSADVDLKAPVNVGLALTALYGDLDAEAADSATGSLDSYYVNLFMRGKSGKWTHSLVFTLGLNSAELNRTVNYGEGSYTTHGSTDGVGFGALYEVSYDVSLNEQKTSILQPIMGISALSSTMKGYDETGADGAGLHVDDQSWTTISLNLGARLFTMLSPNIFGRTALAELRMNVAQDMGDTTGEANVALLANPGMQRTVYGAEVGGTALQIGAGITVPVSPKASIHLNAGSDIRSGSTSWSASAGLRLSF